MGQISVTIQNRTYRLSCDDGEEARLTELASHVRAKADELIDEHGRIGDEHLMLMSAILIADELWDLRAANTASSKTSANKTPAIQSAAGTKPAANKPASSKVEAEPSPGTMTAEKSPAPTG